MLPGQQAGEDLIQIQDVQHQGEHHDSKINLSVNRGPSQLTSVFKRVTGLRILLQRLIHLRRGMGMRLEPLEMTSPWLEIPQHIPAQIVLAACTLTLLHHHPQQRNRRPLSNTSQVRNMNGPVAAMRERVVKGHSLQVLDLDARPLFALHLEVIKPLMHELTRPAQCLLNMSVDVVLVQNQHATGHIPYRKLPVILTIPPAKRKFPSTPSQRPYPRVECVTVKSSPIFTGRTIRAPALVRTLAPNKAKNTPDHHRPLEDSGNIEEARDTMMAMLTFTVTKDIIPIVQLSLKANKVHSAVLLHGMTTWKPRSSAFRILIFLPCGPDPTQLETTRHHSQLLAIPAICTRSSPRKTGENILTSSIFSVPMQRPEMDSVHLRRKVMKEKERPRCPVIHGNQDKTCGLDLKAFQWKIRHSLHSQIHSLLPLVHRARMEPQMITTLRRRQIRVSRLISSSLQAEEALLKLKLNHNSNQRHLRKPSSPPNNGARNFEICLGA